MRLQAIITFAHAVEQGSFTAAARRLGISTSAVTKSIAGLEGDLGTQLFNRTTRSFAVTEHGRSFYERCRRILAEVEDAEATMKALSGAAEGLVRLIMPFSFGRAVVLPALPGFFARYPDIRLELFFDDSPVDLVGNNFDLAVRTGELTDSRLIRRILINEPLVTVASPDYLARHPAPARPEDLARHECVVGRFGPRWQFRREGRAFDLRVAGRLAVHSGEALREAALEGLGIVQLNRWLVRQDLDSGRLVPMLDGFAPEGRPVAVVYPAKRHMANKLAAVIGFLGEVVRS